jgi:hypothetical protein
MATQKLLLIKRHPDKWPRMEWGWPLPDFKMIQDFVRNTPWKNREEKTTIHAYHKLAWQLECPTDKANGMYKLLKAMKMNKSLYCLLGKAFTTVQAPRPTALPSMKKKLAATVAFHTSFQMSINHIPLWGLVDPDKEVKLVRIEDKDGDPQELDTVSMHQVLFKHQVNHLPLWQSLLQNDDSRWHGHYSNGKGCQNHKGVATTWSGSIAAYLKFHLLKRGVTEESALKLIHASCTTQALLMQFQ